MDIFVAKLSSETTADNIKELFSQFGKVKSTKVIMDRETGMSKCYGFVEMEDEMEGQTAIEHLNDSNYMGNYIAVKRSEPKAADKPRSFDRKPGGGGGNRRFDNNNRGGGGDRRDFNRGGGDRRDFNRGGESRGGYGRDRDSRSRGGYNRYE
jgi:cold-inducible RNA-binding protein